MAHKAEPWRGSRHLPAAVVVAFLDREAVAHGDGLQLASWPVGAPDGGIFPPTFQPQPPTLRVLDCRGRTVPVGASSAMVGILNVTPDSFSDGGRFADLGQAVEAAERMVSEGAAMIDIGGQSTRPGYEEISPQEEIARVVPVIAALVARIRVPLSIDTYKPAVARAGLDAGAHVLNDIHGLQGDPAMAALAAEFGCPVIVMHQDHTFRQGKGTTLEKLKTFFDRSTLLATQAGIPLDRIILDPGIGFSKTQEQNLEIIGRLNELRAWGFPVLLGASRKSVIGNVLGSPPAERLEGTLATTALAAWQGVDFIRVHDVAANVKVAKMIGAIRTSTLS